MEHIMEYEKLVCKIASKYSNYSNFEDLKQVGMIGLLKALDKYDKNSNTKFSTYAYLWIRGEILEYLRCDKSIKISKEILSLSKQVEVCKEILRNNLNREPSITEISLFLDKDEDIILEAIDARNIVLSNDYITNQNNSDKDTSLYDMIPYYENGYNEDIIDLHIALNNLNDNEKNIIKLRYYNDMTQSEISKLLGTNQVEVSRMETKIMKKLRKNMVS